MNYFNKLLSFFTILVASFSPLIANESEELPTLDELKRLHIEGNNGQYNLNSLNSIYASGRILYYTKDDTIERGFRIYKKRPGKFRSYYETKLENKLVQLEVIFDGTNAIKIFSHGGREVYRENLEGDSLESVKFESRLEGPFLYVAEDLAKFTTVAGYEYIEDQKCILLTIDEESQSPYQKIWLNVDNFQEAKFERFVTQEADKVLEEVYYRNFKNIQGILFASRMDKDVNGKRKFTTFIDDFNVNYGLFDSLFEIDSN